MFFGDKMYLYVKNILLAIATSFLLLGSIFFTIKLKCVQFQFKNIFKSLFAKTNSEISPIKTLLLSMGARIGVGSIAGVALSIYLGGVGTIFWLCVTTLLSISLSFCETVLGNLYKKRDKNGMYQGGPSYYLKYGAGYKKLALLYAVVLIISYIGGFISIQANTITTSALSFYNVNKYYIAIIISIITIFIIFGGLKKILNVTSKIVPFMALLYIGSSLFIIILNITKLPSILLFIIKSAFTFKSFIYGFLPMFIIGLQRGVFSSESGLGTGSVASSITTENDSVKQGYIQMSGIYISLFICITTAIVFLLSDYNLNYLQNVNGIELVQYAFRYHIGRFGDIVVFVSIFLFSYSTIITGYYYGESGIKFITQKNIEQKVFFLKIFTIIIVLLGCLVNANIVWDFVDILVCVLAAINVFALFILRKDIFNELQCYKSKKI
mgnify:CR=1 FL=1